MLPLIDNWWQYKIVADKLAEWFSRHLLALYISFEVGGEARQEFFSGFLLRYNSYLLWITAGHVIDQIKRILSDKSLSVIRVRWADGVDIPRAEALPADPFDIGRNSFSLLHDGIDFGAVLISGLNELNIVTNGRTQIMTERAWNLIDEAKPEGYYLLGYPDELNETSIKKTGNQINGSAFAGLAYVPIQRIDKIASNENKEFWSKSSAFYGQMIPFIDAPDVHLESIVGMSGGPLLGIQRDNEGHIRYYLYGVQSGWLRGQRIIRAESVKQILELNDTELG